jgi:hypothetical protein
MEYISRTLLDHHRLMLTSAELPGYSYISTLHYPTSLISAAHDATTRIHAFSLQLTSSGSASPSLTTIALLLIILFLSLKILDMLYRTVVFWAKLAFKVAIMVVVVGVAAWVYVRGVDGVVDDARELVEFWGDEYRRYERMGKGAGQAFEKAGWK